jgi:nucleotide-binding universal stress UspA family protein
MYKEILLPVDLNEVETQRKAVRTAVDLARLYSARLHIMTVVPDFGMNVVASYFPEGFEQEALERAREALHAFVTESVPEEVPVQHIVGHGSIHREILRRARDCDADLIVMASHQPEPRDYLLGPNAAQVARHARATVMVVRD